MQQAYEAAVASGQITPDLAQHAVLPALEQLRAQLEAPRQNGLRAWLGKPAKSSGGLYLWGGVGRGKSMLMDMFIANVNAPKRRAHFHAFMQEVHAGVEAARQRGERDAVGRVADHLADEVRLFAFDEMQINDIADAMIVGRLFERLFGRDVVVVTTSNHAPDTLYENGLNRQLFLPFIELIKTRMTVHHLASDRDYRQERLKGEKVYFTPLGAPARRAIDALWDDLTAGNCHPLTLRVQGRTLELPSFATAWPECRSGACAVSPSDPRIILQSLKPFGC